MRSTDEAENRQVSRSRRRILAGLGALSPDDYLTYEELVYVLDMPFHRVRRLLMPLVDSGLVSANRLPSDRRRVGIRLTTSGRTQFGARG